MNKAGTSHHPQSIPLGTIVPKLVSKKTGILKGLRTLYRNPGDPKVHVGISELTDSSTYLDCFREASGTGVGMTEHDALMSALGEAVEGYCAYDIQQHLRLASYREIVNDDPFAVSPRELPLYSAAQYAAADFRFSPFTEDTVLRWTRGTSAISGVPRSLPAALVYVSYTPCQAETSLCHTIFGGIASSTSYTAALLSGLYEAVERDAMMIWWLGQLPMTQVTLPQDTWLGSLFREHFSESGLKFELWHISMDIPIPVFFGLVTDERNNAVAGGFGTNLNPERAALKALFECVQNRLGQLPMRSDWGRDLYNRKIRKTIFESAATSPSSEGFSRMTDLNTNLHAYLEPQSHHLLDGIRSDAPPVPLSSIVNRSRGTARDDAEICLGMLEHKGFDVIVTDLTHEDVSDLGFVVLRVSVPGLVPNSVTAWPHLGNPRLYTVPPKLGFPHKSEADMATFPMPYA